MKNSPLALVLIGLLLVSVLLNSILIYRHVFLVRDLRQLQYQALTINNNRTIATSLANEALEYSKRNPAINPVLESLGIKARPQAGVPAAATSRTTTP